jgi:hypothetical protein
MSRRPGVRKRVGKVMECVAAPMRWVGKVIAAPVRWIIGADLKIAGGDSKADLGAPISLLGLFLLQVAGLVSLLQVRAFDFAAGGMYLLGGVSTAGCVSCILRAKDAMKRDQHQFDGSTISLGRWVLFCCVAIFGVVGYLALTRQIPGQMKPPPPSTIAPLDATLYKWQIDGSEGVRVRFEISGKYWANGVPRMLWFTVLPVEPYRTAWKMSRVKGYFEEDGREKEMEFPPAVSVDDEGLMALRELAANGKYFIDVYFKAERADAAPEPFRKAILEGKGLKANAQPFK